MSPLPDPFPAGFALPDQFGAADVLGDLVAVSLTGVIFYTPLYNTVGELVDFTFVYLNPAAQRMLGLPARPTRTHNEQFSQSLAHGTFAFHVEAFESGAPREFAVSYQADGYDNYYHLAARRSGQGLLVSFTDTADQPRTPVEVALRESQAREQQARAEADAQRQRLHDVLMALPAQVATNRGPAHVYELVNPRYQQLFPTRPLQGLPIRHALPELAGQGILKRLDHVYQTGETHIDPEQETWVDLTNTGQLEQRYFSVLFQALRDGQGRIDGILNFAYDVTEQVLARQQVQLLNQQLEARVQEREAFYQVFAQTPACIALLREPDHRFQYVNAAYQQLFPGRQLVGRPLVEALPETGPQGFVALLDQVHQTGETFYGTEMPLRLETAEGQLGNETYFTFTYQAYREQNVIVGISIFAYDVTEQVLARREREVQQQQLERLFRQAPAAIAILGGADLVYELVNPVYQSLFPGRELPGHAIADVFPELAGTGVVETFQRVYQTGLANEEKSILISFTNPITGQLEERYFNYIQQARRDAYGRIDGVLVFAFEVTEQVQARQQAQTLAADLGTANQHLRRTNVDLDTFIYTASHDLKAPITNIEGLLDTLRDELPAFSPGSEVPYILGLMHDSVERFKHTIEHLTDVSKLQKSYAQPAHPVALAPVIEGVCLDLAPLLQHTGGHFHVEVAAVPTITLSEKNLRSVVFNLLSNALKYRHPDRTPDVHVRARWEGAYAVLEVQDNGLGFEVAREAQLFAMFQRLHTHVEGSGVGLYMVKRLVENAEGHITVASTVGEGTIFTVYLPG